MTFDIFELLHTFSRILVKIPRDVLFLVVGFMVLPSLTAYNSMMVRSIRTKQNANRKSYATTGMQRAVSITRSLKNHKNVILLSITLTFTRCDGG